MKIKLLILGFLFILAHSNAQTVGGNTVYNFLKLSNTPQLTALGGINITNQTHDIGLAFNNPALLRPEMHTQTTMVFNSFYAGIKNYHLMSGYHANALNTTFAAGINYFSYGSIAETDMTGNVLGAMRPADYVVQVSATRQYGERWHYGVTAKFIHSSYGIYRSSGIAMDMGIAYADSANLWQASLVAKNMGAQVKQYTGTASGDLPFDLQLGISKRLAHAPLQFSLTFFQLHKFDTRYNDTLFNNETGLAQDSKEKKYIFDKFFRHVILAVQLYVGDKVEVTAGYNYLRRKELNITNAGNGLNGFSMGVGVLFKKIQIRYARSYYQNNSSYNQFGLNLRLNDYFGSGGLLNRAGNK
ncbi:MULTISPECIES: type IX secretion system protein PorQ [Niastella]|uniref:Type IX secretion system protein PorQ n=1 Tax=Niastella soli TaxID=2821487 RepID=A0ABS3Z1D3_9BACT|nr:type IX secretion system protein PorQ [Niastella soli]MBO9203958.1 type IX secretion system protein PorQ [Niastella soli]